MTAPKESLAPLTQEQENIFWSKVDKNGPVVREGLTPCWVWKEGKANTGYGQFTINHVTYLAHRMAVFIARGTDVHDGEACHACDNRPCVNPDHIVIADRTYNMRDALSRGRARHMVMRGVEHPRARLTDEIVASIREDVKNGIKMRLLAEKWKVSKCTIKDIVHYRTWKNPSSVSVEVCIPKK